ncbi:MAG: AI-2E family transporter [Elusimicrobia bacterium]|nr:AI-2E family transporter [Elusimicrobiota bacterium]
MFFFALLLFVLYEGGRVLRPFFTPIVLAAAVGAVFYPMRRRLAAWWPWLPAGLLAGLCDFLVAVFLVAPVLLAAWGVAAQAGDVLPLLRRWAQEALAWLNDGSGDRWLGRLPQALRGNFDAAMVQERLLELANESLQALGRAAPALAANLVEMILEVLVFLLTLFFVFRDGEALVDRILELVPLSRENREAIKENLRQFNLGVIRGTFLTALLQGSCACVGFMIVGTRGALLLGLLTAVTTVLPGIGSSAVWLPVCLYYGFHGFYGKAVFLAAWGALVVGVVDNIIRPILAGTKLAIPFIWLFFGFLGGLKAFGLIGLILGPIILGMAPLLLEIYRRDYWGQPDSGKEG